MSRCALGGFAEEVTAPAATTYRMPEALSFEAGAALPTVYPTSYAALVWRAPVARGETLLVHAAAGGVGLAAVEIPMAVGARVIAVANGDEKQAILRDRGVEHVIATDGFREKVEEITGGNGLDVVYDPVGGPVSRPSISCLRPGGRLVTIGYAAGEIPSITFNVLLVKNISVMGIDIFRIADGMIAELWQSWDQLGMMRQLGAID